MIARQQLQSIQEDRRESGRDQGESWAAQYLLMGTVQWERVQGTSRVRGRVRNSSEWNDASCALSSSPSRLPLTDIFQVQSDMAAEVRLRRLS